eukprot:403334164
MSAKSLIQMRQDKKQTHHQNMNKSFNNANISKRQKEESYFEEDFDEFRENELLKINYIREKDNQVLTNSQISRHPLNIKYRLSQVQKVQNLKKVMNQSYHNNTNPSNINHENIETMNSLILNGGFKLPRISQIIQQNNENQTNNSYNHIQPDSNYNPNRSFFTAPRRLQLLPIKDQNSQSFHQHQEERPFKIQRIIQDKTLLEKQIEQSKRDYVKETQRVKQSIGGYYTEREKQQQQLQTLKAKKQMMHNRQQDNLREQIEEDQQSLHNFSQYELRSEMPQSRLQNIKNKTPSLNHYGSQSIQEYNDQNQADQDLPIEPQGPDDRVECPSCMRKFNQDSLQKHVKICQKVFKKKRKVFNVKKQRLADVYEFPRTYTIDNKSSQQQLKQQARGVVGIGNNHQSNFKAVHNQYSQAADDRVFCQFCSRKFNDKAADRHIPVCEKKYKQNFIKNLDKERQQKSRSKQRSLSGGYNKKRY